MIEQQEVLEIRLNKGKQEQFCSLPDTIFEALYGGAAGGGKSFSLLVLPLLREFYKIPTFHGLILRRTFPELESHQIQEAHKIYPFFGAQYNQQKKRYKFPSGAIIDFGHAEYESDIRKYDSAEYHYIAPDELTSFTEFQYRYILSRCRTSDPRLPAIVRSASNPGNIGHSFVRDRFVKPCPLGGKILIDENTRLKRIFIQAFASDNPVLMNATPDYLQRLEFLPEAEKQAKLYGNWWSFSGQVFGEFRTTPFPDEPSIAQHVMEVEIPSWTPKILTIDWGYQAATYASWTALFPNKRAVIYREYNQVEKTVEQWTTDLVKMSKNDENLFLIVVDPSAWQNRGTGTIIQLFIDTWTKLAGKIPDVVKADNDRISGKMLVHDFLRWRALPEVELGLGNYNKDVANTLLRLNGLEAYKNYLQSFIPKSSTPEVLPRLLITPNCPILIETIPLCVYSDKKGINGKNVEDVSEFSGDDPYDNLRYALKAVNNYYDKANMNEVAFKNNLVRSEACTKLDETKDMTSFYRKMEFIERDQHGPIAIRIGRRVRH